jgi:hypothetical protein
MKVNLKIRNLLLISFFITLIGNFLDYINVLNRDTSPLITYSFMLLPIAIGIIPICQNLHRKTNLKYIIGLRTGIFLFISFVVISIIMSQQSGTLPNLFWGEAIRLIIPFIYTFLFLNFLSIHDIELFMKFCLIIALVSFFFSTDFSTVTLNSIFSISFLNSYSPFENSEVSFLSFALASFFIYYKNRFPICTILSMLLVVLTFKRVYVLGILLLFIASIRFFKKIKIRRWILYVSSIMWILLIKFYMFLLNPQNYNLGLEKYHFDVVNFSMYRAYRVWYLIQHNYLSSGLTSTTKFLQNNLFFSGTTLELDLIKILMELGIVGVIIFIICYYRLVENSIYAYVLINIMFLQFLMASGVNGYLEMSIILVTVALSNYKNPYLIDDYKIKVPFLF